MLTETCTLAGWLVGWLVVGLFVASLSGSDGLGILQDDSSKFRTTEGTIER